MMNFMAVSLVLTTIITATVFSPSPAADQTKNSKKIQENDRSDVIVKDGHRRVVVEYDNDDKINTWVSISPQDPDAGAEAGVDEKPTRSNLGGIKDKVEEVKEKVKEVTSDVGQRIDDHVRASPRELICDAYGKCKHKIASAIGRTKEKVSEVEEDVKDKVEDAKEKVKEVTSDVGQRIDEQVRGSPRELVCDAYGKCKHKIASAMGRTKEKVHEVEEEVKDAFEKVKEKSQQQEIKETVKDVGDIGKTLKGDIERNASRSMDIMSKNIITRRLSPEKMAGIVELLGVSTGLGTSIWVTFGSSYILARALPRQQFAIVQSKIYPVYFKAMAFSIAAVLFGHLWTSRKKSSASAGGGGGRQEMIQTLNLLTSLVIELINLFILEPRATKIVFDRMKLEKEGSRGNKESRRTTDQPRGRIIDSMIEPAVSRAAAAEEGRGRKHHHEPATASAASVRHEKEAEEEERRRAVEEAEMIRLSKKLKKLNTVSSVLNMLTVMALTWHLVHLGHTLHRV